MTNIYKDISISNREGEFIVLYIDKAYKVNMYYYDILYFIKNGSNYNDSLVSLMKKHCLTDCEVNNIGESFRMFIEDISTRPVNKMKNKSYIKFKIVILNSQTVNKISILFTHLFSYFVFIILIFISFIINLVFITNQNINDINFSKLNIYEWCILFVLSNIFIILHEIGHSAASLKYNLPSREIGFGLYFIMPVFYSNVTGIWLLNAKDRVIVNLAGIYFQLLANMILIFIYLVSNNMHIKYAVMYLIYSNLLVILYSFIPFFRNDGYWIYSDIFHINNLIRRADSLFVNKENVLHNIPLFVYSVFNWIFRIYILYKLIVYFSKSLNEAMKTVLTFDNIKIYLGIIISFVGMCLLASSIFRTVTNNKKNTGGY